MDCQHNAELMPWYLNGTLGAAQILELEEHLEGCEACRTELEEAATARLLFGAHPEARMLVDYAFELPGVPRDLVEAHLAGCDACADELAMALESRGEIGRQRQTGPRARVVPLRQPRQAPPWWRAAAVAAAVLGLIGVGGGLWSWRALDLRQAEFNERERASATRIAELEAEIRGPAGAQLNVPIRDLWPDGSVLRSETAGPMRLSIGEGPAATLILNSQLEPDQEVARLEIRDSAGQVQILTGLRATASRSFTLSLALSQLPRGELKILLFAANQPEPIESYSFELD